MASQIILHTFKIIFSKELLKQKPKMLISKTILILMLLLELFDSIKLKYFSLNH
jgi:hypothetical protein